MPTYAELQEENMQLRHHCKELMKCIPTDTDMVEAGWTGDEIEAACTAYDRARAALQQEKRQ
ncbi:hypothetical protein [Delftia acidovorans]|uniref:Uncharacterized protein n=1 Tax=Delftia acidovorans TaxID=80866 RepID=A0AAJ2VD54_DELAC|nr:hypothetical protein [Delftia acidovorans]MDX4957272.1 hypothetical protein [Delftia acidovorans]